MITRNFLIWRGMLNVPWSYFHLKELYINWSYFHCAGHVECARIQIKDCEAGNLNFNTPSIFPGKITCMSMPHWFIAHVCDGITKYVTSLKGKISTWNLAINSDYHARSWWVGQMLLSFFITVSQITRKLPNHKTGKESKEKDLSFACSVKNVYFHCHFGVKHATLCGLESPNSFMSMQWRPRAYLSWNLADIISRLELCSMTQLCTEIVRWVLF